VEGAVHAVRDMILERQKRGVWTVEGAVHAVREKSYCVAQLNIILMCLPCGRSSTCSEGKIILMCLVFVKLLI
jgi:hypothetical protein